MNAEIFSTSPTLSGPIAVRINCCTSDISEYLIALKWVRLEHRGRLVVSCLPIHRRSQAITLHIPVRAFSAIGLIVCLLGPVSGAAFARLQNPDAREKIRKQVEKFQDKELMRVTFHDKSWKLGCLRGIEADGFLMALSADGGEKVFFGDVASVKRVHPKGARKVFRVILQTGIVAGMIFGLGKAAGSVGGDTPRTVALKVYVVMALSYIGLQGMAGGHPPQSPPCQ